MCLVCFECGSVTIRPLAECTRIMTARCNAHFEQYSHLKKYNTQHGMGCRSWTMCKDCLEVIPC